MERDREEQPSLHAPANLALHRILSDETRCRIIEILVRKGESMPISLIVEQMASDGHPRSMSVVSRNIKELEQSGLINKTMDGQKRLITLQKDHLTEFANRILAALA